MLSRGVTSRGTRVLRAFFSYFYFRGMAYGRLPLFHLEQHDQLVLYLSLEVFGNKRLGVLVLDCVIALLL